MIAGVRAGQRREGWSSTAKVLVTRLGGSTCTNTGAGRKTIVGQHRGTEQANPPPPPRPTARHAISAERQRTAVCDDRRWPGGAGFLPAALAELAREVPVTVMIEAATAMDRILPVAG